MGGAGGRWWEVVLNIDPNATTGDERNEVFNLAFLHWGTKVVREYFYWVKLHGLWKAEDIGRRWETLGDIGRQSETAEVYVRGTAACV